MEDLWTTGRVEDVTNLALDRWEVRRICSLLCVDNGKKLRLCWDGRPLNDDIFTPTFKMEGVKVAARMMKQGDLMFTIDLWNGFHQFELQEVSEETSLPTENRVEMQLKQMKRLNNERLNMTRTNTCRT